MTKAFVFRFGLSLVFVLLCFIKGRQGFFIKHSVSGLCLKVEDDYFKGNLKDWGANYYVKFYDGCLHSHAKFRYVDGTFVHNIEKVGTFLGRIEKGKHSYENRYIVYRNLSSTATFVRRKEFALRHKSGTLEIYDGTYCATPSRTTKPFDGAYPIKTTTCDKDLQKFTFGSVTNESDVMTDVNCASSQVMEVVKAEYGVFKNGKTFDSSTDADCSLPVGCKVLKGLCDGKTSCGITVDNRFTFNQCSGSKRLHMEYRCVDNLDTPITSVSDVRLTGEQKPSEGFIEVHDDVTWLKVHDEDWNKRKQAGLCRHLGYIDGGDVAKFETGSNTLSGDLYCDGVVSSAISCCAYLYTSTATSKISFATCKICDYPLLESLATFPDSVFSSSDGSGYEARLTSNGWCPTSSGSQWLQIDLQKDYYISHIATFGDKDQTKWVTSYSLQYSRTESGLGSNGRQRTIQANHDAYRASITTVNIVAARYLRIVVSTGNGFCVRVELCGVDLSGSKLTVASVGPRTAQTNLKFSSNPSLSSGAISYYLIFLKDNKRGIERGPENITREEFQKTIYYRLENLKPYTNYTLDIAPGNSYGVGGIWRKSFHTKEAAPESPPSNVKVVVRNMTSVMVSWDPLPEEKWNGPSITYTVYQKDSVGAEEKFDDKTVTSLVLGNLKTATEYSFSVSASTTTKVKESSRTDYITKITNQVAIEGNPEKYHSIKINLTKQDAKFKTAYVIVHSSKSALNVPDTYQIKDLYSAGSSSAYITARLEGDNLVKPFEVGAGNWYNDSEPPVHNKPLKGKSKYRIFVRYVESEKVYFSTEWSKEILTFSRPTAPTAVVAKFLDDGSLEISWKSPALDSEAKLVKYIICYKQERKEEKCKEAKRSPYTIPNLDAKARYEIRVLTNTTVGESEYAVQTINDGGSDGQGGGGGGGAIGIAIGIVVAVLIIVLVVVAFFLWRRRSSSRPSDRKPVDMDVKRDDEIVGFHYDVDNNDAPAASNANVVSNDLIYSNESGFMLKQKHGPVPLSEFGHYVNEMKANKDEAFKKDYDELPNTSEASWDIAKKPLNKKKNRFANILTYDHSRVVLSGDEKHDYINASYIDGVGSNTYIASQGPTKLTKNDMWRMVWEQRAYSIVMVTSLIELGKPKCEKYWPDKGSEKYGHIEVTLEETKEFACHKTHTLRIKKDDEEREVKHYYYSSWPDHGVPKYPTQLLAFRRHFRTHHLKQSGPIIVHCSAGVGRTGVFLAIDSTLEKIEKGLIDSIDIFGQVSEMRTRRMNMIQTMEQYKFVHEAILETILCGINEVDSNNIKKEIKKQSAVQAGGMTGFQEKFKRLCDVSPTFFNEECEAGLLQENQTKNRFKDIYPAEINRVNLSYVDGVENSDYINAVFVYGYLGRNYFIATQSPLPNTVNDFWRMVHEKKSSTIVLLNNVKDETTFPQFWPAVRAKPEQYGNLTVQLESTTDEEGIVTRKFVLSQYLDLYEGEVVKIFQYTKWPDHGIPRTADDVITLTSLVEKSRQSSGKGPVIVVCSDGAGRSGTYIAISNLIERMKIEQVVDVFQSIKIIRASRPQFVENAEQFKFCYSAVSAYLDSFSEYSNFE